MAKIMVVTASRESSIWYRPTFSHEHGVYVMLFICLLMGTITSHMWTKDTLIAWICAFSAFQAEHPLVLQIKQRQSWKLRWLLWASVYGSIALSLSLYFWFKYPQLVWIYLGAVFALIFDLIAVRYQRQKWIANELISFAGICLSCIFIYSINTGTLNTFILGLWILNTLFFSSTIFTVKFRKPKHPSVIIATLFHAIAWLLILGLVIINWLSYWMLIAFSIALIKFIFITWQQEWYCSTKIKNVALLETSSSLLFASIALFSSLL